MKVQLWSLNTSLGLDRNYSATTKVVKLHPVYKNVDNEEQGYSQLSSERTNSGESTPYTFNIKNWNHTELTIYCSSYFIERKLPNTFKRRSHHTLSRYNLDSLEEFLILMLKTIKSKQMETSQLYDNE